MDTQGGLPKSVTWREGIGPNACGATPSPATKWSWCERSRCTQSAHCVRLTMYQVPEAEEGKVLQPRRFWSSGQDMVFYHRGIPCSRWDRGNLPARGWTEEWETGKKRQENCNVSVGAWVFRHIGSASKNWYQAFLVRNFQELKRGWASWSILDYALPPLCLNCPVKNRAHNRHSASDKC